MLTCFVVMWLLMVNLGVYLLGPSKTQMISGAAYTLWLMIGVGMSWLMFICVWPTISGLWWKSVYLLGCIMILVFAACLTCAKTMITSAHKGPVPTAASMQKMAPPKPVVTTITATTTTVTVVGQKTVIKPAAVTTRHYTAAVVIDGKLKRVTFESKEVLKKGDKVSVVLDETEPNDTIPGLVL